MKREKKISFTYYARNKPKPIYDERTNEMGKGYQLYVRVTYDRNNTRFPLKFYVPGAMGYFGDNYEYEPGPVEYSKEMRANLMLDKFEEALINIIRYEERNRPSEIKNPLTGLKDRFDFYFNPFERSMKHYIAVILKRYLEKSEANETAKYIDKLFYKNDALALVFIEKDYPTFWQEMPNDIRTDLSAYAAISSYYDFYIMNKPSHVNLHEDDHTKEPLWYNLKFEGLIEDFVRFISDPINCGSWKSDKLDDKVVTTPKHALDYYQSLEKVAKFYLGDFA